MNCDGLLLELIRISDRSDYELLADRDLDVLEPDASPVFVWCARSTYILLAGWDLYDIALEHNFPQEWDLYDTALLAQRMVRIYLR